MISPSSHATIHRTGRHKSLRLACAAIDIISWPVDRGISLWEGVLPSTARPAYRVGRLSQVGTRLRSSTRLSICNLHPGLLAKRVSRRLRSDHPIATLVAGRRKLALKDGRLRGPGIPGTNSASLRGVAPTENPTPVLSGELRQRFSISNRRFRGPTDQPRVRTSLARLLTIIRAAGSSSVRSSSRKISAIRAAPHLCFAASPPNILRRPLRLGQTPTEADECGAIAHGALLLDMGSSAHRADEEMRPSDTAQ